MKIKYIVGSLFLGIISNASAFGATYEIDAAHSKIGFKVRHLAISSVSGDFSEFSGKFDYEPEKPESWSAEAKIMAKSINTNDKKRDDHLRAADFFDAEKIPALTFKSTNIQKVSSQTFKMSGDLTMHNVTKPVSLYVVIGGAAKDMFGNERVAFSASTKLNRKDFGLAWNKVLETGALVVGDEITVELEIEGIKAA